MAKKSIKKIIEGIKPNKNEQFMEIGIYFERDGIRVEGSRGVPLNEAFEDEFGKKYLKIRDKYEKEIGDKVSEYSDEVKALLNDAKKFGHYTSEKDMPQELAELLKFLRDMGFEKCDCGNEDCDSCADCDCDDCEIREKCGSYTDYDDDDEEYEEDDDED